MSVLAWGVGGARVEVVQGDIVDQDVDALANAANTALWLGAGVAGAIRARGGPEIQEACDRHGPIPLGEAVVTGAGSLGPRFVIHAAGMHLGGHVSADSLASCTRNTLQRARELGVASLALPAIGTGMGGFPLAECARIMVGEVAAALAAGSGALRLVRFVLFSPPARDRFAAAARAAWGDAEAA